MRFRAVCGFDLRAAAVLVGAAVLALSAGQALANHVSCGDVITQDTTLDSDLIDCPGDGIVIGADNITLDLNGHTIDGDGGVGGRGVRGDTTRPFPHDGITVFGGEIRDFSFGVYLLGSYERVRDLGIALPSDPCCGFGGITIDAPPGG